MSALKPNTNKQPFDALAKVAVIGDSSVGKTNILLRYVNSEYQMTHITTIGIDFKVKTLVLDGFRLKMQIWDTAGQERFRNLSGTIYQGAQAIILVYSIANRKTFDNVQKWVKDISEKAHGNILLAIVGNKCDLKQEREVSSQQGILMAKQFNAQIFMQTSAKEGTNIDDLFEKIGRKIKEKIEKSTPQPPKVEKQTSNPNPKTPSKNNGDQNQQTKTNTSTITNQTTKNGKIKLTNEDAKIKKKKNCEC